MMDKRMGDRMKFGFSTQRKKLEQNKFYCRGEAKFDHETKSTYHLLCHSFLRSGVTTPK